MGEVAPLGEDELAAIERDAGGPEVRVLCAEVRRVWAFCDSLRPLVAEVGRLRAENERLRADVASAEQCYHWRRNDCTPNGAE